MRKGFSLVELSISLVIIGLITGGIMAGSSLLRSAELRSVFADYDKYKNAAIMFRQKYDALPGDFGNALATWGPAHATPATCVTTASTNTLTCDGNDDGIILPSTGSNESFRFWQHLVNASYIEGQYDGITHGSTAYSSTAANSPTGRLNNSLWFVWNWGAAVTGSLTYFDGAYNNFFEYGATIANADSAGPIFKPEELWNIDTKIDDGKPATGTVVMRAAGGFAACTNTALSTNMAADYLLSSSSATCAAIFRNLFIPD